VARVRAQLESSVALREACQVPLSLSLLAFLSRTGTAHAASRRALYDKGLQTLLECGHQTEPEGVRNPESARVLLGELSLVLQAEDGEAWPRRRLEGALRALPAAAQRYLSPPWDDASHFLNDVAVRSGVLAAHDGNQAPWRFFHRQFRELLAAEALRRCWDGCGYEPSDQLVLERAKELAPEHLARWAEVFGFACEQASRPLELLATLGKVSNELALRVLPELEAVDPIAALGLLTPGGDWNGTFLVRLFARWREQGTFHESNIVTWLWNQVTESRSLHELAALHYALVHVSGIVDRERFFRRCGRWPEMGPPAPALVEIPEGEFWMGSPDTEKGRRSNEKAQARASVGVSAGHDGRHERRVCGVRCRSHPNDI
jgi:hypothetical protein